MDLITSFCGKVREVLESTDNQTDIFARCRDLVSGLALTPVFLKETFQKYASDDEFLMNRVLTADSNEVTLYIDPDRLFSLRLYIWDTAKCYPIHDHGSWGVVSCVAGEILERKYERVDDGSKPGYAKIREVKSAILKPGETTVVLPLNQGIHKMESVYRDSPSISLHLYGKPLIRRGYLECYNIHKDTVYRIMSPYRYGRAYVLKALGSIKKDWSAEILEQALMDKPYMRYEALRSLALVDKVTALKYLETEKVGKIPLKESFADLYEAIKEQGK